MGASLVLDYRQHVDSSHELQPHVKLRWILSGSIFSPLPLLVMSLVIVIDNNRTLSLLHMLVDIKAKHDTSGLCHGMDSSWKTILKGSEDGRRRGRCRCRGLYGD